MPVHPDTPIAEIPAVSARLRGQLEKIGYTNAGQLIAHYPRRYEDRTQFDAFPTDETGTALCLRGEVVDTAKRFFGRRRFFEAAVEDVESGGLHRITLRWFNMAYIDKLVAVGQEIVVYGKVKQSGQRLVIDHPEFETIESPAVAALDEDGTGAPAAPIHLDRITPIYPLREGIGGRPLRKALYQIVADLEPGAFPEILPGDPANLPADRVPRAEALRSIHFPTDAEQLALARRTLALEEFFALQLNVARRRAKHDALPGAVHCGPGELLDQLLESLPFEITGAQRRCIEEVRADLGAPRPMNRLLQGDVGSGKTLVAVGAILLAVESGCQAALMAPTQILAEQHHLVLSRWLEPLGIRVGLRTANKGKGRKGRGADEDDFPMFESDPPEVIVGTHALFYDGAEFDNLGLVVIDEQHKFGVAQRGKLIGRGACPDVLVMTATPIPRTLTLTVYGDLDVSVLDELPKGRGKIVTAVRDAKKKVKEATKFIRDQLDEGRQAYIVYPLVEDSDKLKAKSVEGEFEQWAERLAPFKCDLLHGRVPPEEKELIMRDFRDAKTDVLVATTVIEVGVDVPNANIMYIYNAERFGLAQLHQLRGRIGRGAHKSYCILMADKPSAEAKEKLGVLEATGDGFEIAEADLRIRGAGELLGTAQSGLTGLKLGDLVTETDLVQQARDLAAKVIAADPDLEQPEHRHLQQFLLDDDEAAGVVA